VSQNAYQIQYKPIADLKIAHHLLAFALIIAGDGRRVHTTPELIVSHQWPRQQYEAVNHQQCGDGHQKVEPKPDEEVDLLVVDIDGQHTQGVDPLPSSRRAVRNVSTFAEYREVLDRVKTISSLRHKTHL
jgi:hypothetical protein